jgi:integrase
MSASSASLPCRSCSSTGGTLRDPNNFGKQWRTVRERLGVPGVTTHSFRKTVATLIDDEGLSARIGADHLGHKQVPPSTKNSSPGRISSFKRFGVQLNRRGVQVD